MNKYFFCKFKAEGQDFTILFLRSLKQFDIYSNIERLEQYLKQTIFLSFPVGF